MKWTHSSTTAHRFAMSGTILIALSILSSVALAQTPQNSNALSEQSLGKVLVEIGLKPSKQEKRFDFRFKTVHETEEWELSMSAVLSQNGNSLWVMAWLDELPKSAAEVPRTALLRLLADNDKMGKGKFFAYIASNRRFVLQRVIENENIDAKTMKSVLLDLGATVVETHPHWSVQNWLGSSVSTSNQSSNETIQNPKRTATRDSAKK